MVERTVVNAAAAVQTVPSLALLALMVPLLSALGFRSIGFLPAFIALILYSSLPILRNTVTGLAAIDATFKEAAQGVGMSPREQLLRVELPLALPFIMTGIRTGAVWTVGAATLATPVGADSLGNYIFTGLQTRNLAAVVVGCVSSAALALSLDGLTKLLQTGITDRKRRHMMAAIATFSALYLYAGGALAVDALKPERGVVVVGAKTFTEQYILSEILARRISTATGLGVELKQSLGSSVAFDALRTGSIDVYVDYSGTIWANVMKRGTVGDRNGVLAEVSRELRDKYSVTLVAPLGFENTYALAMHRTEAERLGVRSISDLVRVAPKLSIGGDYEFFGRPEWRDVRTRYGVTFREQRSMDASLMYQAVASKSVDVISAFSTDGRIAAFDLVVLKDDLGVIPPYDAVILAGPRLARSHPEVLDAFMKLRASVDPARMRSMNQSVDLEKRSPAKVAHDFLSSVGL
jgi:osmoprotectant transport system permease protein